MRTNIPYAASNGTLHFDLYPPSTAECDRSSGAVILVTGYPDPGFAARMGCKQKDLESNRQWAQRIAAAGLVAIAYENSDPVADAAALLDHVSQNAEALGVDRERIGLWSCSANVPTALHLLATRPEIRSAALCYGFMLDDPPHTGVAQAQAVWHFANPCAGKSFDDLSFSAEMLIVRAGRDEFPGVNASIDRFFAGALHRNLGVSLINYAEAPHAFDTKLDTPEAHSVIARVLDFMKHTLS
jgi:dienelactone hydrolase